ncbi:MAG: tetratricopeptide repeat protein [Bacteroidota bacterium]|nr:tetratricopeptide repeat protein [Bacteroidota bacterium]
MKKLLLLTLCFCVSGAALFAQTEELSSVFEDANRLYLEQKYDAAISRYESIVKNGYESGEVYFNLGNAYFKSGKLQNAILNFERAKKIIPNDDDVNFNLQLANVQLIDKVESIPELFIYRWMDSLLTMFSLETMVWLIYVLFLMVLGSFSVLLFARSYERKRYSLMSGMIVSFFLVVGIANFLVQSYRQSNSEFAIVMTDVANIKSAPDSKGNDLFVIHRGIKVQLLDSVNKWKKIRLVDGKVGWIPEGEVETI